MMETNAPRNSTTDIDVSEWLDAYGDQLFRFARSRVRDRATAEDLVQETFLSALQSAGSFNRASTVGTWLTGILKHKIVDHYRRASVWNSADLFDRDYFGPDDHWRGTAEPTDWHLSPEQVFIQHEFRDRLIECLKSMPEILATVFTLREIEMLSRDEICELLSLSQSNYWVMLHRARLRLRQMFQDRVPNRYAAQAPAHQSESIAHSYLAN